MDKTGRKVVLSNKWTKDDACEKILLSSVVKLFMTMKIKFVLKDIFN